MGAPASYSVSGLELFNGATLKLEGNSYLEAQGKDSSGSYLGCAIVSQNDIIVEDNATINANAYGVAISTGGNVKATGGKIIAKSSRSNGIFAE